MALVKLVKHSKRTLRKPCKHCGKMGLYWAHNTSEPHHTPCKDCGVSGKWVLIEQDLKLHSLSCAGSRDDIPEDADDPAPATAAAAPMPTAPPDAFAAFKMFMDAMAPKVDRAEVAGMIKEELANVVFPTRTVVLRPDGTHHEIKGSTHHRLPMVIKALRRQHVMMVGPAGTGKSTIAKHAAEALGLPFYSISLSPQTPASALLGYMQAAGEYVGTLFRQAYEFGGVFNLDELDNGHPSTLAVMNSSLANGEMGFPDGMVKRHPDFKCVASANTYGKGADRRYVGRQQIDAATLDRFAVLNIDVDETLETEICLATGLEGAEVGKVLTFVRKLRANGERKGMDVVLSPRASAGMCELLIDGFTWDEAVEARVRRGASDQDWAKLNAA